MLLMRYNTFFTPDVAALERILTEIRNRLYRKAKDSGWDV